MTIDEIYHAIGQTITNSIVEDWTKAILRIDRLENYTSASGTYTKKEGIENVMDDSLLGYRFSLLLHELHSITTEGGFNRWNKLQATLYPSGKFEMDFIWDEDYQNRIDSFK